jgi:hypothetical protein
MHERQSRTQGRRYPLSLPVLILLGLLGLAFTLPTSGTASTLTFTNFVHHSTPAVLWDVMIDEATANLFTVKVRVDPTSTVIGDILGLGFNVAPTYKALLTASDIAGTQVTGIFQNTGSCGQGCNFNGVTPDTFDRIVRIGHQIATPGQTLDTSTFTMVGIRAQSVGPAPNGGGGSAKDTSSTRTLITAVPEPSSTLLLALALGSMYAVVCLISWRISAR